MGITIHYQGKAKSLIAIDELIDVMKEFANTSKWKYHLVDEIMKGKFYPTWGHGYGYVPSQDDNGYFQIYATPYAEDVRRAFQKGHHPQFTLDTRLKGIQLEIHSKCEWLEFLFDLNNLALASYEKYDHSPDVIYGYDELFCKTQYAGPRIHIIVCKLLKVAEQYVDYTTIYDEGNYYQSQDLNALIQAFGESTKMLESIGKMLKELGDKYGMKVITGGEEE